MKLSKFDDNQMCNVTITRNDMARDGMDLKSWWTWQAEPKHPLKLD